MEDAVIGQAVHNLTHLVPFVVYSERVALIVLQVLLKFKHVLIYKVHLAIIYNWRQFLVLVQWFNFLPRRETVELAVPIVCYLHTKLTIKFDSILQNIIRNSLSDNLLEVFIVGKFVVRVLSLDDSLVAEMFIVARLLITSDDDYAIIPNSVDTLLHGEGVLDWCFVRLILVFLLILEQLALFELLLFNHLLY